MRSEDGQHLIRFQSEARTVFKFLRRSVNGAPFELDVMRTFAIIYKDAQHVNLYA